MKMITIPSTMVQQIIAELPIGSTLALSLSVLLQAVPSDPPGPQVSPELRLVQLEKKLRDVVEKKQSREALIKAALPGVIVRLIPDANNLVSNERIAKATVEIADAVLARLDQEGE